MPSWLAWGSFGRVWVLAGTFEGALVTKHEQIKFTLLENGMNFIASALEHLNQEASKQTLRYAVLHFASGIERYAVLHFASGIELIIKVRAVTERSTSPPRCVDALRRWHLAVTEQPLRAQLVRLHYEIAPLLPVDSSSDRGLR